MQTPIILREGSYTPDDIQALRQSVSVWKEHDIYEAQLKELFEVLHPETSVSPNPALESLFVDTQKNEGGGDWIYFPWSGVLLHTLSEKYNMLLRTNRNQLLITKEEQQKLQSASVGVVGLSVGSAVAVDMVYSGYSHTIKLAEYDSIDTTNLNRIQTGLSSVGKQKIDVCSQRIFDINPYADVHLYEQGISKERIDDFLLKDTSLAVLFEIIDDFEMKIKLRQHARIARIPVVMLTNLGDTLLVDIERFDTDPTRPIFHGLVDDVIRDIEQGGITDQKKKEFAIRLVGKEHVPQRAKDTLKEMGKTLVGRPQLMGTIAMSGGVGAYVFRKIVLGHPLPSGRYHVKMDSFFSAYDAN